MNEKHPSADSFSVRLLKSLASAKGPRRDDVYVISTALWFEKIRSELNLPSPYAVERHLEPHANGTVRHDNNWAKYAIGRRRPGNARVEKIDIKIPGTARFLKHPLWDILRKTFVSALEIEAWIRTLDGDIQTILLRKNQRKNPDMATGGPVVTKTQLDMLKRRAGLDALAALILLVRKATLHGQSEIALKICDYIYQVLLITCLLSPFRLLVREIFDCFQRRVFAGIQHNGMNIDVATFDCKAFIELLDLAVRQTRSTQQFGYQQKDIVRVCCALLDAPNIDVIFALAAPHVTADKSTTSRSSEGIEDRDLNRVWGIRKILRLYNEDIASYRQKMKQFLLSSEESLGIPLGSGGVLYLDRKSIRYSP